MLNVYRLGLVGLTLAVNTAWSAFAYADPDNRPGDRFFFGLGLGMARGPTAQFDPPEFGGSLALAYETSYWPNDYFGFGIDLHVNWMSDQDTSITNLDLGLPVVVGVPLRWVQPYAGVWLGLDRTYLDDGTGNTTSGFRLATHPIAGLNGYLSRNLRAFVQWQSMTLRDCPSEDSSCRDTAFGQELIVGLRSSPDWFHRLRGSMKFQTLYSSLMATALAWCAVMWKE